MHLSTVILEYKNSSSVEREQEHMKQNDLQVPVQIHKVDGKNHIHWLISLVLYFTDDSFLLIYITIDYHYKVAPGGDNS